ncbi:hypothetical protein AB9P05_22125 [Roseivirga sp. BDSF3-8]|uniref:hypothetical protein n=1 Tax=Roseivirga sp. BDSF3-8 TaxID=3241598 RepID=UPI003531D185
MINKDNVEVAKFWVQNIVLVISACWILMAGTNFIEKQTKEQELKNLKLSKSSIPIASTTITSLVTNNDAWGEDNALCTISGRYNIKNIGEVPFRITGVTFMIYEIPVFTEKDLDDDQVTSFTLSRVISSLDPLDTDRLIFDEVVGKEGELQRSFGFIIRKKAGYNYSIMANATGGLIDFNGGVDSGYVFSTKELVHHTGSIDICPSK